ncbi:MAG TPA: CrcB family protein [Kofleriaceae bacterium]|jgi:CrcB protein
MERFQNFLVIGAGGAIGSCLRYAITLWTQTKGWTAFPWATLFVNVAGCFLITFIFGVLASGSNLRLFLTTGIMGGLTTYSNFDYETTRFFQQDAPASAFANVGVTLVACFAAGLLGVALSRVLVPE